METEHGHPHPPGPGKPKNFTQVISLLVGAALCVLGLSGLLYHSFAGLHLSIVHSMLYFAAGSTLFYVGGFKDDSFLAYHTCLYFGILFGALSIFGFILGKPGMPSVGFQRYDEYLWVIVPGFQELGKTDHVLGAIVSIILMGGALDWSRRHLQRNGWGKIPPQLRRDQQLPA